LTPHARFGTIAPAVAMTTEKRGGCRVHADFDPLSPTFLADPFAVFASLPTEMPVFYAPFID
jgi:hypothetical protein